MYIGETLSPGFYAKYYDLIDKISLGTAVRSDVVEGYGVVRIIQVTSILMIPGCFCPCASVSTESGSARLAAR